MENNENKHIDIIEHVQKFNPFHDAKGRFSSSRGFATYSANPKTKAGQMAINRSASAGHGTTLNVHRESKGENITQNATWIVTGQKPAIPAAQMAGATQAAKPKAKPQAKPKAPKKTNDADGNKGPHKMAEGTDLTKTIPLDKLKKMTIEEVLEAQGFNGKPQVEKSTKAFAQKVRDNGNVAVRSVDGNPPPPDILDHYVKQLKEGDFYVKCEGGNRMGRGMYCATDWYGGESYDNAYFASKSYGPKAVNLTIDKSAKKIDIKDLKKMAKKEGFDSMTWADDDTVNEDIGAFAAAKGYDVITNMNGISHQNYTVVLNRTKITICEREGNIKDDPEWDIESAYY